METLTRKIKYTWLNRLSNQDREDVVSYYKDGFPILRIARAFNTSQSTIKYHLKTREVWEPWKKSTQDGKIVRKKIELMRGLAYPSSRRLITNLDDDTYWYDEYGQQYKNVTKSYEDYLREERNRVPIVRDNHRIENKGAGVGKENFKCMIHIDIKSISAGRACAANILAW